MPKIRLVSLSLLCYNSHFAFSKNNVQQIFCKIVMESDSWWLGSSAIAETLHSETFVDNIMGGALLL